MARKDPLNFLRFVVVPKSIRRSTVPVVTVRLGTAFSGPVVFTVKIYKFNGVGNEKDKALQHQSIAIQNGDYSESKMGLGSNAQRTLTFSVPITGNATAPVAVKFVVSCTYNAKDYVQQSGRVVVVPF